MAKAFLVCILIVSVRGSIEAQCQMRAINDTGFTQDPNRNGYVPEFPGEFHSFFRVTRVVGPGTSGEFDANGSLLNAALYQQNGVLGRDAYIRLSGSMLLDASFWALASIGGAPTAAEALLTFTINRTPIGKEYSLYLSMTGPSTVGTSFSDCVRVPSQLLRFAHRLDTGGQCLIALRNGETTCPAINEVEVSVRLRAGPTSLMGGPGAGTASVPFLAFAVFPGQIRDAIQASGTAGVLTFEALSPVLLMHGINANSNWFDNFKVPFDTLKIPYQALGPRNLKFGLGPGKIESVARNKLSPAVQDAAQRFGAKHIHIMAHSKGGLWSRALITEAMPAGIGLYSLTTLDTPHHGSVASDLRVAFHAANWKTLRSNPLLLAGTFGPDDPSADDLTIALVDAFNRNPASILPETFLVNGRKNRVAYFSLSADANLDNSTDANGLGTIQCPAECRPDWANNYSSFANTLYQIVQSSYQITLTKDGQGNQTVHILHNPEWLLNDFMVTVNSAKYTGFNELRFWKKDHTTIGDSEVLSALLASGTVSLALERSLRQ